MKTNPVIPPTSNVAVRTDPRSYDAANQPTQITDPLSHTRTMAYDAAGNLTQQSDYPGLGAAPGVTDYWYDWSDRQVAVKSGVYASESEGTNRSILVTNYLYKATG